jgi:hypothetical protein
MKKGLINEAFRLQQLAGIAPINEVGLQKEVMAQAQITSFSPEDIKSISFPNGTVFTVGDVDMEGGIVISIEKTAEGFEVSGYGDGEGYTYYYDEQGNEIEMEGAKPGLKAAYAERELDGDASRQMHEEGGATKTYYTVNTYGVTEIKPYEAFGFDGTEEWEEVEFEFPSSIIKKYYTTEDGVGKVVADANASEEEVLTDLEEIDTELFY